MVVHSCRQDMLCLIESVDKRINYFCSFVYASNSNNERKDLWDILRVHKNIVNKHSWVLMGDFNVILRPEEQSNGSSVLSMEMCEFRDAVNTLEIEDLCSSGFNFTWTKSLKNPLTATLKKLDRIMINEEFVLMYKDAHAIFLPYLISDHSLSIMIFPKGLVKKKKSFRFMNFVADKSEFLDTVNDVWKKDVACIREYTEVVEDELKLLHQKAKIHWLKEGDRNSAFFHSILKARKRKSMVESICKEDRSRVEGDKGLMDILVIFSRKHGVVLGKRFVWLLMIFFLNGRLLGEINATLIALVPKIDTPNTVSDFRPIACCNVLYKCISKILTNRIKDGLSKVVSINQSAFIPGRHIQDNILISQEILKGYNRKNGTKRCVMKIEIQKAYDTISWDFLRQALVLVGFHKTMINWIMTCVTTASFSVCINGEICGFLKGGENIAANHSFKCHHGCKELKLTHMCFVDDLMVLCNADKTSTEVVKKTIEEFSCVSGLFPNLNKSIIFFGSVCEASKKELLEVLPFKIGKLPMKQSLAELDKLFKWFLWNSGNSAQGKARVSWNLVCRPKEQGGLANIVPRKARNDARMKDIDTIADLVHNEAWMWPSEWLSKFPILSHVEVPNLNQENDTVWWINDSNNEVKYSVSTAWHSLKDKWLKDKILWQQGMDIKCPFCKACLDTHDHLFFSCPYLTIVWKEMKSKGCIAQNCHNLEDTVERLAARRFKNNIWQIVNKLILSATVYHVWNERNKRIFKNEAKTSKELIDIIKDHVIAMLLGLKVKSSGALVMVAKTWGLNLENGRQVPMSCH
ncbi:RNA-directed DNA polymerase, eukaryota, reverse transcriptase zinc-binding domain protein [Tanacetum coccineum]